MKIIDPSVQKTNLAIQVFVLWYLKLITFGKSKKINNRYERVLKSFSEIRTHDKL